MTSQRASGTRTGLVLILLGFLLPVSLSPFCVHGIAGNGTVKNPDRLYIPLVKAKETPVFQLVKAGEENRTAQLVQFEDTRLFMEFPEHATITEIAKAVRARFPDNTLHSGDPQSGRIRFEGWSIRKAASLPFRCAVYAGLFLVFLGGLLIFRSQIFRR